MARVLSGLQPSGDLHLGNYLGAVRNWVADQDLHDAYYCIVDLHALTLDIDPAELRRRTYETALDLLAAGLDPDRCTLFVQGHVPEHPRMTWLLECIATMGELNRMTQFKDKSAGKDSVRAGLFTYPVLQCADILLYDAERVPVGDDQRQHLELARELALRFNHRFGETLVVPEAAIPTTGARVMDLQHPERKMSKSVNSPLGTILLFDDDAEIVRKVKKAVTDTDGEVRYDREAKPGLSNLLELLAVSTGRNPVDVAGDYTRYGDLKNDVAQALVELVGPIRQRREALAADPGAVTTLLSLGAEKAGAIASATYQRAADAIGLLPRG
jgi:tryptophanyl-tRNA synthetase